MRALNTHSKKIHTKEKNRTHSHECSTEKESKIKQHQKKTRHTHRVFSIQKTQNRQSLKITNMCNRKTLYNQKYTKNKPNNTKECVIKRHTHGYGDFPYNTHMTLGNIFVYPIYTKIIFVFRVIT